MVQSIYRELTGDKHACPRTGAHWDVVGFQGNDPATDLRGAGLFGLIQVGCCRDLGGGNETFFSLPTDRLLCFLVGCVVFVLFENASPAASAHSPALQR
jgi:hypothetical protein